MKSNSLVIHPFRTAARGLAQVPGSKSITNRALIIAVLADGETLLTGALFSRDTRILIAALQTLGFTVVADEVAHTIKVHGLGGKIPQRSAKIHVGNAGTAARFLTAFLALAPQGCYELDGDEAMRARPMAGLLTALRAAGCQAVKADGSPATHFPFTLHTTGKLGALEVDASASSQLLSALLMVLPLSEGASVKLEGATVSEPFVEMTVKMCAQFGRPLVKNATGAWSCPQPGAFKATPVYVIEPDATAASYFIALGAVAGADSRIRLSHYTSGGLQGDTAFAAVASQCGAVLESAPDALLVKSWKKIGGGEFDFNAFSDTFLTLATLASLADSPVKINGIGHTRKQETDRVLAMATELTRLGIRVEPNVEELKADSSLGTLKIYPDRQALRQKSAAGPVSIHTYEDHRMAMSFGILGSFDLWGDGRPWICIEDPGCTSKTFPTFFTALEAQKINFVSVAMDGGAASGKSSTSRLLAERLGLLHVDTGLHYRSLTHALLQAGAVAEKVDQVERALEKISLGSQIVGLSSRLTLDQKIPDENLLRGPEVNASVSQFAALPPVRNFLLQYQRLQVTLAQAAGFAGIVMEGRDIGSVVLPQAEVRIFLEASAEARSQRRAAEGQTDAVAQRDHLDTTRKTAPLICPPGATRIDNTTLSLEAVVQQIAALVQAKAR
jgi:3-phosphoshikimate 1-carboxyvinyltransferase